MSGDDVAADTAAADWNWGGGEAVAGALGSSRPSSASRDSRADREFIGKDSGDQCVRIRPRKIACRVGVSIGKLSIAVQRLEHLAGQPAGEQLAAFHIARERAEAGMTGQEKQKRAADANKGRRKSALTLQERKERNRAYQRERYRQLKAERD